MSTEHGGAQVHEHRVLCLSHLGWDGVWQRPQQVLSRLARHTPVLHVNEPRLSRSSAGDVRVEVVAHRPGLTALQPVFPDRPEVVARWRELYVRLLRHEVARRRWLGGALVAWFSTPVPFYVVDHLPFDVVVYDVMDELAGFRGAAADLRAREDRLLLEADVVFAGGRSLFESRRRRHPNVHLFPSGVDAGHWTGEAVAPEIAALRRPVLGYVGVVDERVDLALVDALAASQPDWSVVLVGPVAKIEPARVPRRANVHHLGQQPYERLPSIVAGFDVALMPFALNAATRFISPTKALEYMAARRPVVSTPVPDVVAQWEGVVEIADGAEAFAGAVEKVLSEPPEWRQARLVAQDRLVAAGGWDRIVEGMWHEVAAVASRASSPVG